MKPWKPEDNPGVTHWGECWRAHHGCAIQKIEQLLAPSSTATSVPEGYVELPRPLGHASNPITTCECGAVNGSFYPTCHGCGRPNKAYRSDGTNDGGSHG
jgi:hypothetical protein